MPGLRELEEQFFRALQRPHGSPVDPALAARIVSRAPLDGAARIDVYAHMYCSRIIGSLLEDFPAVARVLGAERFDALAHAYLAAHPCTDPSLRHAGAAFSGFLAAQGAGAVPLYLPDLARLEWAQLEVFDAEDASLLTVEDLQAIPPDAWGGLRLRLAPAVRLLDLEWPVQRLVGIETAAELDAPAATALRVWRRDMGVFVASPEADEAAALAGVASGRTFGALCADLAAGSSEAAAAEAAAGLVVRWIDDGILAREVPA